MKRFFYYSTCFLLLVSIGQASEKSEPQLEFHCSEKVEMGTPFKICVYVKVEEKLNLAMDFVKSFTLLKDIDAWMSEWRENTNLSMVNNAAGAQPVKVREELFSVLKYALQVSEASQGAFDPTFNAFWGLYNFKEGQQRKPSDSEIKERLPLINYHNVVLDEAKHTVFLKEPGMKLGLGGLGQGYAVDKVVEYLKKHYQAGYVDGSGDLFFWGKKPGGELWTTAIRDPADKSKNIATVYGTDFAVTTCGDDEKFFMEGNKRIHHIIDPKTGKPSEASRQVTIIAQTALQADAFDTAGFVLGPVEGKKTIEKMGMQGVFVSKQGVSFTAGLRKQKTEWGEVYVVSP